MRSLLLFVFCFIIFPSLSGKDKKAEIIGQKSLVTNEGQPITIHLTDLIVDDPENHYPNGFALEVFEGKNYTIAGATVIPKQNFTGPLRVSVRILRDKEKSKRYDVIIQVLPVDNNVAPIITGQVQLSTTENKPIEILLSHLTVYDPDDSYPNGFTLKILSGNNYSFNGGRVTPSKGFVGTLTVSVKVNDGKDDSPVFDLKILVNADPSSEMRPVITGQQPLTINKNESLAIQFSHLIVNDPDNSYPTGFSLTIYPGSNYTFSEKVVTPANNFAGMLSVKVTVNDGLKESEPFNLKITVLPGINHEPIITGQVGLSTFKNQPINILLSNLVVNDPDNNYPNDFTLIVFPGDNYTVTGNTVTPSTDFIGLLSIGVTVNDGTTSSKPYNLQVHVIDRNDLQIVGQKSLTVNEDSTITLRLTDLIVNDPNGKYPAGFSLKISNATGFTVENQTITPQKDFDGNITVGVSVSNGVQTSATFNLLIVVKPVNDAPEIKQLENNPLLYAAEPVSVTNTAIISDVDDQNLIIAEIGFETDTYQQGNDELLYNNTTNIRGVFDTESGILTFIGDASLAEYQEAIRGVQYNFSNGNDATFNGNDKSIYLKLNDGKAVSNIYKRSISILDNNVKVNIPNAFTPNDDNANDTWNIEPLNESTPFRNAFIRVYNKNGRLVYESDNFERPWDGRMNGDLLPPGSYFYSIEVDLNNTKKNYKGVVTILR